MEASRSDQRATQSIAFAQIRCYPPNAFGNFRWRMEAKEYGILPAGHLLGRRRRRIGDPAPEN
jgi:hypothetical protein